MAKNLHHLVNYVSLMGQYISATAFLYESHRVVPSRVAKTIFKNCQG